MFSIREASLAVISTLAVTLACGGGGSSGSAKSGALQPAPCDAVTCPAPTDSCHVAGTCDPSAGTCSAQTLVECPDGETCSLADGACHPVNLCAGVTCQAPTDGCHVAGVCEPSTGTCSAETPVGCPGDQVCDPLDGSCKKPVTITELAIPPWGPGVVGTPNGIAAGPDGNLWITVSSSQNANLILRLTPEGDFDDFPAPSLSPGSIAAGADGNLWFSNFYTMGPHFIHRMATDGTVTGSFTIPSASDGRNIARGLTPGPDGNVWFVAWGNGVGRITPDGVMERFPIPTAESGPVDIVAGPDGNLWFTEGSANQIGRITVDGEITGEFPIETAGAAPAGIAAGPDGDVWFTESGANRIGRITPDGLITEYELPTPGSGPQDIVAGPDGNLWFTESKSAKIGRITPGGVISEFDVPGANAPGEIAAGADGNLWFTERLARKIGKVTIH